MVFGIDSFLMKFKIEAAYLRATAFCWNCLAFKNIKQVPTVSSVALKALETVSALKQLCICNQKELKPLVTKNPDCTPFRYLI